MALKVNLDVDQGATFTTIIYVTDENEEAVNLSSYTARGQIRKNFNSANASAEFTFGLYANGIINMSLTSTQTANLSAGRYLYDMEIQDSSNVVTRVIEGQVTVAPNITR